MILICSAAVKSDETTATDIFISEVPNLVWFKEGKLGGPSFHAFDFILRQIGINPTYSIMPSQRAVQSLQSSANSCAFPVEQYDVDPATMDSYLLLAAVPAVIYSTNKKSQSREELIGAYAVTHRTYFDHRELRKMRINTILVDDIKTSLKMFTAKRVDYILLPEFVALSLNETQQLNLHPVIEVSEGHIWLACNKNSTLPSKASALNIMKELVRKGELQSIYQQFGLSQLAEYQYNAEFGRWAQAVKAQSDK